jgi:hypothetical protein
MARMKEQVELMRGTLDLMICEPCCRDRAGRDRQAHSRTTEDLLQVETGSLCPALIAWKPAAGWRRPGRNPTKASGRVLPHHRQGRSNWPANNPSGTPCARHGHPAEADR